MNKIYELPTGFGKSLVALKQMDFTKKNLIVIPKLCLIDNWKNEMKKWGYDCKNVEFTTYISLKKYVNNHYSTTCYDEAQHLSERARGFLEKIDSDNRLFLSATFTREIKEYLFNKFICTIEKKTLKDAINSGRLPDPEVYLIPLELDTEVKQYPVIKNFKNKKITYYYTQQQFYNDLEKTVEWYKNKVMYEGKANMKNMWMSKCLERNKWLSRFKEGYTKNILKFLKDKRVLTFCCDIKQTEELGKNCINSKNKQALQILQDFNDEKINHITAATILNEGANLTNCQYGIFNYINSSELVSIQRLGRLLRHCEPIIYIPYFVNTREEELMKKLIEACNVENITTLSYPELIYMLNNLK